MKKIILIFTLFLSTLSFAQDKVWNLNECIHYAVEHNIQKIQQKAQNKIYQLDQVEAIGSFVPTLSASTSVSFRFGRAIDGTTNSYISTDNFSNSYDVYSSLTLFDGLASVHRLKLAKIYRKKGDEELRQVENQLALEIIELYFNTLYYEGSVDLAEKQWEESSSDLNRVRRMEEVGLKSLPDVAEIEAKEAEDRLTLTRQQNLLRLGIIKLKEKMNFPANEMLKIEKYESAFLPLSSEIDPDQIYSTTLSFLPKVQMANYSLKTAETDYRISKSNLSPRISMSAGYSTGFFRLMNGSPYMSFSDQLKDKEGRYVGFSLSIPIISNFSRITSVKRSKQRLIIAEAEKERVLRQVYSEIEQVVADVKGLYNESFFAEKRTESMKKAHQVNRRKYDEGLINAIEFSTSSNRLLSAQVEELHTKLNYQLKCRLLEYYKGKPLVEN